MSSGTTLADRAVLRLSGDDVRGFLQGLVTQDMRAVAPGAPQWSALLTPQGKALFDFILWADGDDILVDCEAARADALAKRLAIYRLRRAITIAPDPALAVHWATEGGEGVADPRLPALGGRWIAAPDDAAEGWLAHRLRLGVTEGVAELGDGDTLWLECNARELNGTSFTKGCFVGQENTARMHHRQKVNRRLAVLPAPQEDARIAYDALGLSVVHRRIESLAGEALPAWMREALVEA